MADRQLLHIVIGGELKSVDGLEFRDLSKVVTQIDDAMLAPRNLARDPQYFGLSRCDRLRSADADSWPRLSHVDSADRSMGLAHADPSSF